MNAVVETLKVPGASLYYEVRGAGPVLLMIPGGACDVGLLGGLAGLLANRYTVVTCEPRGNSRSPLDGPDEDQRIAVHADDAHRLLATLTAEPACVLGSSGGGLVGLELVARHPDQVRTLVAHEPPCLSLLLEAEHYRAFSEEVHDSYLEGGIEAAMERYFGGAGRASGDSESTPATQLPPEMQEALARTGRNWSFFFAHLLLPWVAHVPDLAALRAAPTRVVVAAGAESAVQPVVLATRTLAECLGVGLVEFPGDHGGPWTATAGFAEALDQVLSNTKLG